MKNTPMTVKSIANVGYVEGLMGGTNRDISEMGIYANIIKLVIFRVC